MKKLSLYIFLVLLLISNANASDKNYFVGFTYWDNLKQVQKNFYVKGALDAWGYYIWNNAPDDQKDMLISKFRYCIDKEFDSFQEYMFMLGWENDDNAADEIFRWSSASCKNLSKTEGYKNIKIEKNKPIENVNLKMWKKLEFINKKEYIAGYVDGSISVTKMIIGDQKAPEEMKKYYSDLLNGVNNCFSSKSINTLPDFVIKRKIDKSFPLPWNISFALGEFCKDFK